MLHIALLALVPVDVLDVDQLNGPYYEIRHAVAAAIAGDVIRVGPGTYEYFGVLGRGLTVVRREPAGTVLIAGVVRVQDLPAGQTVVLSGLVIRPQAGSTEPSLIVADCDGSVRLQNCEITGDEALAARIQSSTDVTLVECIARGGWRVTNSGTQGHSAVQVLDSSLAFFGGAALGASSTSPETDGGEGLSAVRCELLLHGATLRGGGGGDGAHGWWGGCFDPGSGGHGVFADQSDVRLRDCYLVGGQRGSPVFGCSLPPGTVTGGQGLWLDPSSTSTVYPGTALTFDAPALATEATQISLLADGDPGDLVLVVVGSATDRVRLPAYVGDLYAGGPVGSARRALLGSAPVTASLQMPTLAPFDTQAFFLQTVHLRPGGEVVFGPVRGLQVLDSAW